MTLGDRASRGADAAVLPEDSERRPVRWQDPPEDADPFAVVVVPISSLLPGDSPRIGGEDAEHVRILASADFEQLPPVLVHRPTMRVIDGMHRVQAAKLRGEETVAVRFFNGSADSAFVEAVRANVAHGLPLSLADREAAAVRILEAHPDWSDRAVAKISGLADTTVSGIRKRSSSTVPQLNTRVGADGRVRPLNSAEGRRAAGRIIDACPETPLRQVARESGVSLGTARDVRERLRRGEDPVPERARRQPPPSRPLPAQRSAADGMDSATDAGLDTALRNLRNDPAIRYTESGRALLQWLGVRRLRAEGVRDLVQTVPSYWTNALADLARECAGKWQQIAEVLDGDDAGDN
ncbi:ParB/RepB/Spo0J family partition protein [Amycolatopsis sp. NPDC003676]